MTVIGPLPLYGLSIFPRGLFFTGSVMGCFRRDDRFSDGRFDGHLHPAQVGHPRFVGQGVRDHQSPDECRYTRRTVQIWQKDVPARRHRSDEAEMSSLGPQLLEAHHHLL